MLKRNCSKQVDVTIYKGLYIIYKKTVYYFPQLGRTAHYTVVAFHGLY